MLTVVGVSVYTLQYACIRSVFPTAFSYNSFRSSSTSTNNKIEHNSVRSHITARWWNEPPRGMNTGPSSSLSYFPVNTFSPEAESVILNYPRVGLL